MYNQYIGGIDQPDMMSSLYKLSLRTRRWYIYVWLHTVLIASVNVWFLHCPNLGIIQPNEKFVRLKTFLAQFSYSLVNTIGQSMTQSVMYTSIKSLPCSRKPEL